MKPSLISVVLSVVVVFTAACAGDTPGSPSDVDQSRAPSITVSCPEFGESSRCTAYAAAADTAQDVTGLASWSTSDPSIATVNSTGLVSIHATGEVGIRAAYQGVAGSLLVWAVPGQGLYGTSRTLTGAVLGMNGRIPDVLLEILDGPNAGRRTTTTSEGRYSMADLHDGRFTVRLSKPGYLTVEYVFAIPQGSDRVVTMSVSPG